MYFVKSKELCQKQFIKDVKDKSEKLKLKKLKKKKLKFSENLSIQSYQLATNFQKE